ncbi:MAG: prolyl oligopeptidase family serine peptidase [Gammaproteobacteria bacterium]|nr:prolyl oligopeptidase family serine peptidase [Gammaproteobacteria bacterium]
MAYRARQLATLKAEQSAARTQRLPVRDVNDADRDLGSEADYLARNLPGIRCEHITYESDGLRIRGFLWTPTDLPKDRKLPIIVFNRGGTGEDSKLRANTQFGFERFVRAGYAVIGSQYRGNDGGDGVDEVGGADVRDVLRLAALARELPFADPDNLYALGYSRGAMMTLSALRDGALFNAVALVGLPADFRTPDFDRLFVTAADATAARDRRSAMVWAERLAAPMLLLQGSGDPLVSTARQTLPFAARLQELGKTYELVIYHGDTHGLMFNGSDRDARILEWFSRFRR